MFAANLWIENFNASSGWLAKTLNRYDRVGINLHGEADDMDPEERQRVISEWKDKEFHPIIEKYDIPADCIYSTDQTGWIFYCLSHLAQQKVY